MISLDDLKVSARYWFTLERYRIFGTFHSLQGARIVIERPYIYPFGDENFFVEEILELDPRTLFEISVDKPETINDFSDYYKNYSYK